MPITPPSQPVIISLPSPLPGLYFCTFTCLDGWITCFRLFLLHAYVAGLFHDPYVELYLREGVLDGFPQPLRHPD